MGLSAKNRWIALTGIIGILAASLPEYAIARFGLAALGIVGVIVVVWLTERSESAAAAAHTVEINENLDAHATTHDFLRTVAGRLFRDQDEILRSGSLVDRLRLATVQLALFSREQQLSNPRPPMTMMLEGTELSLTEASRAAVQFWTEQNEEAMETFRAFVPQVRDLLNEAAARPHVGQLVKDAVARIETVTDPAAVYGFAAKVNEIAKVIEDGKPLR